MAHALSVLAVSLLATVALYGTARLVVLGLIRTLAWRSPLRLLVVLAIWFAASAILIWPLYFLLLAPELLAEICCEGPPFFWALCCYVLSVMPFALAIARHRDRIVSVAKRELVG
ncbi:MAG: hypothetical protein BroJett031_22950 [Betaproteobacteria bacterium]|nr:MAG: hypothetical protein BroJett031_22950 [Betaproteobacteria bacterium]